MAIKQYTLAKEGPKEDPSKKRLEQLDDQIKQAQEQLKLAKETDSKSERVFNLNSRINTLKGQRDRLKHRSDEKKDNEKKEHAGLPFTGTVQELVCYRLPNEIVGGERSERWRKKVWIPTTEQNEAFEQYNGVRHGAFFYTLEGEPQPKKVRPAGVSPWNNF